MDTPNNYQDSLKMGDEPSFAGRSALPDNDEIEPTEPPAEEVSNHVASLSRLAMPADGAECPQFSEQNPTQRFAPLGGFTSDVPVVVAYQTPTMYQGFHGFHPRTSASSSGAQFAAPSGVMTPMVYEQQDVFASAPFSNINITQPVNMPNLREASRPPASHPPINSFDVVTANINGTRIIAKLNWRTDFCILQSRVARQARLPIYHIPWQRQRAIITPIGSTTPTRYSVFNLEIPELGVSRRTMNVMLVNWPGALTHMYLGRLFLQGLNGQGASEAPPQTNHAVVHAHNRPTNRVRPRSLGSSAIGSDVSTANRTSTRWGDDGWQTRQTGRPNRHFLNIPGTQRRGQTSSTLSPSSHTNISTAWASMSPLTTPCSRPLTIPSSMTSLTGPQTLGMAAEDDEIYANDSCFDGDFTEASASGLDPTDANSFRGSFEGDL